MGILELPHDETCSALEKLPVTIKVAIVAGPEPGNQNYHPRRADLERSDCRPSRDLYVILEKFPRLGAGCSLHRSSYRSIRNLPNGLMHIRRLNGNRLAVGKAVIKATPQKICYRDRSGINHTT